MIRRFPGVLGVLAVAMCAVPVAQAQVQSSRHQIAPPGTEVRDLNDPRLFDLNMSVAEGYDGDVTAGLASLNQSSPRLDSYYSELQASGEYHWRNRRLEIGATGASTGRYVQQLNEFRAIGSTLGAGLTAQLARRTTLSVNGTAAYSPAYLFALFPTASDPAPGDAIPSAPDYRLDSGASSYAFGARVRLTHEMGTASGVSLTSNYWYTNFLHETDVRHDLANYDVEAAYNHTLSRHRTLTLAYRHSQGEFRYSIGRQTMENGIDGGIEVVRPLSATRSLTASAKLGASAMQVPAGIAADTSSLLYRATADADLSYDFNRSWQLRGAYHRGLDYLAVVRDPVFTQGVTMSVDGFMSSRLLCRASAGYSSGVSALNLNSSRPFRTYTGTLRVTRAMSQALSVYVESLYYYYDFHGTAQLQPGLPLSLDRIGARIGLTMWVPVRSR